jgi:hypothetical protein
MRVINHIGVGDSPPAAEIDVQRESQSAIVHGDTIKPELSARTAIYQFQAMEFQYFSIL